MTTVKATAKEDRKKWQREAELWSLVRRCEFARGGISKLGGIIRNLEFVQIRIRASIDDIRDIGLSDF